MMDRYRLGIVLLVAVCSLATAGILHERVVASRMEDNVNERPPAANYHLTDLGVLNSTSGQRISKPTAINNAGDVTGYSYSGTEIHAFRYSTGVMQDLGTIPGGSASVGFGINDQGQVTGESQYSVSGGAIRHAALFANGTATDLGFLPGWGNYSRGNAINDAGQVVGHSGPSLSTSNTRSFIWDAAGGMRDMGSLGGQFSKAFSINDAGMATGTAQTSAGGFQAFVWDAANGMRPIGVLGGTTSSGNFINANGHITGSSTIANDNRQHAFIYDGTTMRDLGAIGNNDFLSDRSFGYGINIRDEVVGSTYKPYEGGSLYQIAFLYAGGEMRDLQTLLDSTGSDYRLYSAVAINDAGQIAAEAIQLSTGEIHAVRLTPNAPALAPGTLDPTFGSGGRVFSQIGTEDRGNAVVLQPDGKIVVGGRTRLGAVRFDYALARYNTDGSLDTTFGTGGKAVVSPYMPNGTDDEVLALALQPDGKIVAVGILRGSSGNFYRAGVVRFNSDGSLDQTFGTGGIVLIDYAVTTAVVVQSDGKIVCAGGNTSYSPAQGADYRLARLNPDGTLDASFGTGGLLGIDFAGSGDSVWGLALQPDGKILAAGSSRLLGDDDNFSLARINTDGTLDAAFGINGKVATDFAGDTDVGRAVTLQNDGKIIVSGVAKPDVNIFDFGLVRYNSDGSVDTLFGNNGRVTTNFDVGVDIAYAVKVQTNGKIVAAGVSGGSSTAFGVARYNPDGSLDSSFGSAGKVETFFEGIDEGRGLQIQPDGKIVVAGTARGGASIGTFALARYIGDAPKPETKTAFDFDGDGRADIGVYRGGTWHIDRSSSGYAATAFGVASDRVAPADYDGDGKTDIAVFRDGAWYILQSTNGQFVTLQYGLAGDIPQPGDYDGDGDADTAVFRPSNGTWYVRPAGNTTAMQFGSSDDIPLAADRDGDGKFDLGVFRPATGYWYWTLSSTSETSFAHFGQRGDIPVTGDFDGSGRPDLAVFRPSDGTWYIAAERGIPDEDFTAIRFGTLGDEPVPADYDGDGKTDVAVFRGGTWYVAGSTGGATVKSFGISTDRPLAGSSLWAAP